MNLQIVEAISTLLGTPIYLVIDNDSHLFKEYGKFRTKKEAKQSIKSNLKKEPT